MQAQLELKSLGKRFNQNGNYAFEDISLSVSKGELIAIIGPSGCGKSTMLHIAAGLSEPTSGSVWVNGERVVRPRNDAMYVFQQYSKSIFPWKTVIENVLLGVKYQRNHDRDIKAHCLEQLKLVGLNRFVDFYPYQLSGGMQQRVAIARALARHPDIIFMDEPFGALDAMIRTELQDLLLKLWKEMNLTVLFVTHDIDEAIYLAQRVVVLSTSPGAIAKIIDVPLAYPRDQITTRSDPIFIELRNELFQTMVEQSEKARVA